MSWAGWAFLRDAYADAWEVRTRTGDTSPDVLVAAFGRHRAPKELADANNPGDVVIDLWNRGVEPRHLLRELHRALPGLMWKAVGEPVLMLVRMFARRDEDEDHDGSTADRD